MRSELPIWSSPRAARLAALLLTGSALLPLSATAQSGRFRWPTGVTAADCTPGTVVFRVADAHRAACGATAVEVPALRAALAQLQAGTPERMFPHAAVPTAAELKEEPRRVDLSLVYRVRYAAAVPLAEAVRRLRATGVLRYAEPEYRARPAFVPNDPSYSQQSHLPQIEAPAAWDLETGDSTVVIGIVDTGFDINHPDLSPQWVRNYADPVNGLDDDQDGYVDNFLGWDMAGPFLAQPTQDNNANGGGAHGSHVAGLAGAAVNNGVGGAGVGYRCRLLPVKCGPDDNGGYLINAYAGVVYAADHGCHVINCSWGALGYPDVGQDAINYATFNRGALVVVAAGNNNSPAPFSPAGFENVLTVGAVDATDRKAGFSNYGVNAELFAPGVGLLSTLPTNGYGPGSGTSMASPVAAGAAGLVRAHFPTYSGEQVGQVLRQTCDNIDALNPAFAGQLGRGRLNVRRALSEQPAAVRLLRKALAVNGAAPVALLPGVQPLLIPGATAALTGEFKSILAPVVGLTAVLSTTSTAVTLGQQSVALGDLGTGQVVRLTTQPFTFTVSPTAAPNTLVRFLVTYAAAGGYSDVEAFELVVNPSWRDITVNQIHTSLTSKGRVGFNDNAWTQGLGLTYRNQDDLIAELGLVVATDSVHVPNTVTRLYGYPPIADDHFTPVLPVREVPLPRADADLETVFTDAAAPDSARIGLTIRAHARAWAGAPRDKFVLLEYTFRNTSGAPIPALYAGLFADWDIGNGFANKADWDSTRLLGYGYSNEPDSAYAGIRFLGAPALAAYRAIDFNASAPGNPWGITDGFTGFEKWRSLSRGVSRSRAGIGRGADVAGLSGAGPYTLAPGDSVTVAFALVAGENLADLQAQADSAAAAFNAVATPLGVPGSANAAGGAPFPNPVAGGTAYLPAAPVGGTIDLLDVRGRLLGQQVSRAGQRTALNVNGYAPGVYVVRVQLGSSAPRAYRLLVR